MVRTLSNTGSICTLKLTFRSPASALALAKSALSQLEHSTAPEVTFALQTLNRRTALFVRQWGCHPTSESASLLDSAGAFQNNLLVGVVRPPS